MTEDNGTPDVPTITREELQARMKSDRELVLVEALPAEDFEDAHLPGAVNLPPDRVRELAPTVLPDREADIVVYCANEDCPASPRATALLRDLGYENAVDYEGGKDDWRQAGLPLEQGSGEGVRA